VLRLERVLLLLVLAIGAYAPALHLPFIEDDYGEIPLAQTYASAGWEPLWHNRYLRTRATSMAMNAAIDEIWGFVPLPFHAASILVHALCVLLIYAAAVWREVVDESTAFWAACFFGIYEGHQEAVMWISARSEALLFLFGMSAWLCWILFLRTRRARWYALAVVAFVLAAFSKESFVIFPVLMLPPCIWRPDRVTRRTAFIGWIPFAAIAAAYLAWAFLAPSTQAHYLDDRFMPSLLWPIVLLRSLWRLMFVWGFVAIAVLLWAGWRADRRKLLLAAAWMVVAIVPYTFLTYMPQVASRHTYVASAGLALLVGTAAARLHRTDRRVVLSLLCIAALALNVDILWVKKISQFRERAEPSELLKTAAGEAQGPISISCTPYPDFLVEDILKSVGSTAIFPHPETQQAHCFNIHYKNKAGAEISIYRKIQTEKHGILY
jgi:hypothetical protein